MFLPIFSSTGLARSNAAASPPTMKLSVPAAAPAVPPETGASMKTMSSVCAAPATLREDAGAIVEQSITSVPGLMCWSRPCSLALAPRYSDSTCRLAGSIEMTIPAFATACAGLAATLAPAALAVSSAAADRS